MYFILKRLSVCLSVCLFSIAAQAGLFETPSYSYIAEVPISCSGNALSARYDYLIIKDYSGSCSNGTRFSKPQSHEMLLSNGDAYGVKYFSDTDKKNLIVHLEYKIRTDGYLDPCSVDKFLQHIENNKQLPLSDRFTFSNLPSTAYHRVEGSGVLNCSGNEKAFGNNVKWNISTQFFPTEKTGTYTIRCRVYYNNGSTHCKNGVCKCSNADPKQQYGGNSYDGHFVYEIADFLSSPSK